MTHNTVLIGLDTHKETIAVAIAEEERDGDVRYSENYCEQSSKRSAAPRR